MAIRHFTASPERGLRNATASDLPNLVVVAGPNGAGKSTLLHQLWRRRGEVSEPGTNVTYVGPHRPWRKVQLESMALYELSDSYREMSGMDTLPGWRRFQPPGLENIQRPRLHESSDETWSLIKLSLAKKELRRTALIEREYRRHGDSLPKGALPDPYLPLKRALEHLLPHLQFSHLDMEPTNIRALFARQHGTGHELVDLDDLSSGEKAIIALLFPFLEGEIDRVLRGDQTQASSGVVPTAIIDEPDLHLHPTLQVSLLQFFRGLADASEAQFIMATHSPTILDALRNDELFLLAPTTLVGDGNQFVQVTRSGERLEAIRSVTGGTHVLTRCRPIVYVEGEPPAGRAVSDQRLVELLVPEASSWALISAGGRSEAVKSATVLRDAATENLPGFSIFALVDADQRLSEDPDWVVSWPVAMIENLLLDPKAIWSLLEPYREKVRLTSADDVSKALHDIARALAPDEVRIRIAETVRPMTVRPRVEEGKTPEETVEEMHSDLDAEFSARGGIQRLAEATAIAGAQVKRILDEGRELEGFRGKEILAQFFDRYAKPAGFARNAFTYEIARMVKNTDRVADLTRLAVRRITFYIPAILVSALDACVNAFADGPARVDATAALELAQSARRAWEQDQGDTNPKEVREAALRVAHAARDQGLPELHGAVLTAVAQMPG